MPPTLHTSHYYVVRMTIPNQPTVVGRTREMSAHVEKTTREHSMRVLKSNAASDS